MSRRYENGLDSSLCSDSEAVAGRSLEITRPLRMEGTGGPEVEQAHYGVKRSSGRVGLNCEKEKDPDTVKL